MTKLLNSVGGFKYNLCKNTSLLDVYTSIFSSCKRDRPKIPQILASRTPFTNGVVQKAVLFVCNMPRQIQAVGIPWGEKAYKKAKRRDKLGIMVLAMPLVAYVMEHPV
jgi:hypothetical protein